MTGGVVQMSFILGIGLAVVVGLALHFGDIIFSKDPNVLRIIAIGIPVIPIYKFICKILFFYFIFFNLDWSLALSTHQFVAGTQPINALAFVFDGVNFGASDFAYSSYSMVSLSAIVHSINKQNNLLWLQSF